jgi:acyl-CoA dehydrogenase
MLITGEILLGIFIVLALIFSNIPLLISSFIFIAYLLALTALHGLTYPLLIIWLLSLSVFVFFNLPILRRRITAKIFSAVKHKLPTISDTEQTVLEAGDVWWEKELLIGRPNWKKFLHYPAAKLTAEETAFLNNQVEHLCRLLDDWQIIMQGTLSQAVWDYIKQERFLGLSIPKKYGGHEFSAFAHSSIIMKIASRSYSAAVDIMVPNSVGLAEFILQYGTEQQKSYFLPKFVTGEAIPCFALTAPLAGSDAGAMLDKGVVTYGEYQGQRALGILLNWDKRYITLAPIATMIGLAFKLYDPEYLLGDKEEYGITLAMVPRDTPGVAAGARHCPLMMAFTNGPVRGRNVFIPIDFIIGGPEASGQGWQMMMESLAVGRGISLPALSTAAAKLSYRMTGAYVKIREQFHTAIGYFDGIKEVLARIGAFTYLCEATRRLTASAIDAGITPSIATAITKYHLTEMSRKIVNDAMDIHGGRTIQLGPRNYLGLYCIAQPIGITVEGANILTRNLIIFGQGALRCHPYIQQEIAALHDNNATRGLKKFDRLLFKHIGFLLANFLRCAVYGLSHARFIKVPVSDYTAKYYRQLTRMSAALSLVTDISMGIMGGKLKQQERLSARLGDILSYLYLASAALKYYEDNQKPPLDLYFIEWLQSYCLYQIENAFKHFFANFPKYSIVNVVRKMLFPWGYQAHLPKDFQDHQIAELMMHANALRDRLTEYIYLGGAQDICKQMDEAFLLRLSLEEACRKLQAAVQKGEIKGETFKEQIISAKTANIFSDQEVNQLLELERLQLEVIQVDEFEFLTRDPAYGRQEIVT